MAVQALLIKRLLIKYLPRAVAITLAIACLAGIFAMQLFSSGVATAAGACGSISGGAYAAAKLDGAGMNPSIVMIAFNVAQRKLAMNPDQERLTLALFETGIVESGFKNYANAHSPESLQLPHDAVGEDHDSVGFLQQQYSTSGPDGRPWGAVKQLMDPSYAANRFLDAALAIDRYQDGSAGALAQAVQSSAFPARYDGVQAQAAALLAAAKGGKVTSGVQVAAAADLQAVSCGSVDGSLQDPGVGPQGADHLVPRARNVRNLAYERWGCAKVGSAPCLKDGAIGGWRPADGVSDDHPAGRAVDVMVTTPGNAAAGNELQMGWSIANYVQANAKSLGVNYIIFNNKIWSVSRAGEGWRTYCDASNCPYGPNAGNTERHMDHVHVSVLNG